MSKLNSSILNSKLYFPSAEFVQQANLQQPEYDLLCKKANDDYLAFWQDLARDKITWQSPFTSVLNQSNAPFYKWFEGGMLNVSYNCIDRHLDSMSDKIAFICETDDGVSTTITYAKLHEKVCQFANALKSIGIGYGDRVILYMPHSIDAIIAMQAIARIGAIHCVVFGGFSAKALSDRIIDAKAKCLITVDEYLRGGKLIKLKAAVDEVIEAHRH